MRENHEDALDAADAGKVDISADAGQFETESADEETTAMEESVIDAVDDHSVNVANLKEAEANLATVLAAQTMLVSNARRALEEARAAYRQSLQKAGQ